MNILTVDIETSPNKAWSFGVWQTNIAPGQLIDPTYMLSFAAKWVGDKKVVYRSCHEENMLETLHVMMSRADMIVTYNGDSFDLKHINREFALAGLTRVRPSHSMDLFKIVKATFKLPSNKLDYVCSYFLGERKLDTGGFDLWPAFMEQEPAALRLMQRYNKRDVVLTEKLYMFLRPWIKNHPYGGETPEIPDLTSDYTCPACGSHKVELDRPRRTRCYAVRVVHCNDCGNWFDGRRKKI